MTNVRNASFASLDAFKTVLGDARLIFFHVFEGEPEANVLRLLDASSHDELLLLLDVGNDEGFLASTPITVEITEPPRQFRSKPLIELRGLGAWAKGTLFDFETNSDRFSDFIKKARAFALGGASSGAASA